MTDDEIIEAAMVILAREEATEYQLREEAERQAAAEKLSRIKNLDLTFTGTVSHNDCYYGKMGDVEFISYVEVPTETGRDYVVSLSALLMYIPEEAEVEVTVEQIGA